MARATDLRETGEIPGTRPYTTAAERANSVKGAIGLGRNQDKTRAFARTAGAARPTPPTQPTPAVGVLEGTGGAQPPPDEPLDPKTADQWKRLLLRNPGNQYLQRVAPLVERLAPKVAVPMPVPGVGGAAIAFAEMRGAISKPVVHITPREEQKVITHITPLLEQKSVTHSTPPDQQGVITHGTPSDQQGVITHKTEGEEHGDLERQESVAESEITQEAAGGAQNERVNLLRRDFHAHARQTVPMGEQPMGDLLSREALQLIARARALYPTANEDDRNELLYMAATQVMELRRYGTGRARQIAQEANFPGEFGERLRNEYVDSTDAILAEQMRDDADAAAREVAARSRERDQKPWEHTLEEFLAGRPDWGRADALADPYVTRAGVGLPAEKRFLEDTVVGSEVAPYLEPRRGIQTLWDDQVGIGYDDEKGEMIYGPGKDRDGAIVYTDDSGEPIAIVTLEAGKVVNFAADRERGLAFAKAVIAIMLELEKRQIEQPLTSMTVYSARIYWKLQVAKALERGEQLRPEVREQAEKMGLLKKVKEIREKGLVSFVEDNWDLFIPEGDSGVRGRDYGASA